MVREENICNVINYKFMELKLFFNSVCSVVCLDNNMKPRDRLSSRLITNVIDFSHACWLNKE